MPKYDFKSIEPKWQSYWKKNKSFKAERNSLKKKYYLLEMFPYPSGRIHMGHVRNYGIGDVVARFMRMKGFNVLHPIGWYAFGLPAENAAIQNKSHPAQWTEENIAAMQVQLRSLGLSYDWDREIATCRPEYYRWNQWCFLKFYEKGLVYRKKSQVNWCNACNTVLANEQVIDGCCWRCDGEAEDRFQEGWFFKITDYADRLLEGCKQLSGKWPEQVLTMQSNWIGKSYGAEVDFKIKDSDEAIKVFTTRPDTLYGAMFMVLAPEHPFTIKLSRGTEQESAIDAFVKKVNLQDTIARTSETGEKEGIFTGAYATNPLTGESVPVWTANFVLMDYGTGAIMAVPAHDQRDFEFAKKYDIPILSVVAPTETIQSPTDYQEILAGKQCYAKHGKAINSGRYDGLTTQQCKSQMIEDLARTCVGKEAVNFKLRDWLFSRQRFWGEPFPILHELDDDGKPNGLMRGVDPADLPVDLPHLEDYKPHGRPEPPLAKADDEWLFPVIDGKRYRRETNTMPQWAGSCWYFLRFIDPENSSVFVDPEKEKAWMPVDLYVGGAEHAVLHLLYARFWHKVLFDRGHVSSAEPFQRLVNQGMILGEYEYFGSKDADGNWVAADQVKISAAGEKTFSCNLQTQQPYEVVRFQNNEIEKVGGQFVLKSDHSVSVKATAEKMAKSRGNVINPDSIVDAYGADTLRLYEMFMGPLEQTKPWNMDSVGGVRNFLGRVWRMIIDDNSENISLNCFAL